MKKKKKIGFWIVLGVFTHILTTIGTALAPVGIVFAIEASYLEFSYSRYSGYKKTPPSGSLKTINLEEYNRLMLLENTFVANLFRNPLYRATYQLFFFQILFLKTREIKEDKYFLNGRWNLILFLMN